MLQNIFFHEITMFSDFFTFSNITIAALGMLAGVFLSLVRVRIQKEKKDFTVAVISVWVLFHLCAWFYAKVGSEAGRGLVLCIQCNQCYGSVQHILFGGCGDRASDKEINKKARVKRAFYFDIIYFVGGHRPWPFRPALRYAPCTGTASRNARKMRCGRSAGTACQFPDFSYQCKQIPAAGRLCPVRVCPIL